MRPRQNNPIEQQDDADLAGSQLLQEAPSLTFFCSLMGSMNVLAECRGAAEHNS